MINELYTMTRTLKEKNLLHVTIHRDINNPANSAGIYIEVDQDGMPKTIEYISKEEFSKLWKHSKGNHNSFPIVRIQKPLIKHKLTKDFDAVWKRMKQKGDKVKILSQLDFNCCNPKSDDIAISQWTKQQLIPVCEKVLKLGSLYALISRFPNNQEEQREFYIALLILIKTQLATFDEPMIELMKDILIGKL